PLPLQAITNSNIGGLFAALALKKNNYGVYAVANNGTSINYAVYGEAPTGWAGFFNGGTIGIAYTPSDSVLKTNISNISNPISTIKQLKPKSFYFDTTNSYGLY